MDNPFDQLGAQPDWTDEDKAQFERIDYLIHQVFAQTEAGQELLEIWIKALLLNPTAQRGDDLLNIGMAEGMKSFIRNILLTLEKVEKDG